MFFVLFSRIRCWESMDCVAGFPWKLDNIGVSWRLRVAISVSFWFNPFLFQMFRVLINLERRRQLVCGLFCLTVREHWESYRLEKSVNYHVWWLRFSLKTAFLPLRFSLSLFASFLMAQYESPHSYDSSEIPVFQ